MTESNFLVKNGLVVNTSFTANSTVLQANGLFVNSSFANIGGTANIVGNTTIAGGLTSANLTTTTNTTTLGTTVYVVAGGNVGIGNTAPNAKLAVTGTANISGNTIVAGGLTGANLTSTTNTSTFGTAVYIVANGNLGVGTSSPATSVAISAPTNTHIIQLAGNSGGNLPGPVFGGSISYNFTGGGRDFGFWNNDTTPPTTSFAFYQLTSATTYSNLMFIASNGNVGIANSQPNARLAVTGTANISGNTIVAGGLTGANLTSTTNTTTIGTTVYVVAGGNVGIGNTAPDAKLAVTGTANISGNTIIAGGLTSANLTTTTNTTTHGTTLYIVAGGNVGISNSAPDAKFAVTGTANVSGNVVIGGVLTLGNSSVNAALSAAVFSGIGLEPTQSPRAVDLGSAAFVDLDAIRYTMVNAASAAYSLTTGDNGKLINITTGGVTVNGTVLPIGFNVQVFNNSAANQTITSGTGVTMYQAGTANTGNRTLLQRGIALITCVAANTFVISGSLS